jgi:hypothetical protein
VSLHEVLWRNQGQLLTPELIVGIIQGASYVPPRFIDFTDTKPREYKGYTFHVERYADAADELKPLHAAHWQETEKHRNSIPLNYDYEGMKRLDYAGGLVLFTIRRDGELVGQSTMKLHISMHSGTPVVMADEDSLFLRQDHRGGFMMVFFIRYMDDVLTALNVREVRVSSKLVNKADKLMIRAGFKPFATQLVKLLGVSHEN